MPLNVIRRWEASYQYPMLHCFSRGGLLLEMAEKDQLDIILSKDSIDHYKRSRLITMEGEVSKGFGGFMFLDFRWSRIEGGKYRSCVDSGRTRIPRGGGLTSIRIMRTEGQSERMEEGLRGYNSNSLEPWTTDTSRMRKVGRERGIIRGER